MHLLQKIQITQITRSTICFDEFPMHDYHYLCNKALIVLILGNKGKYAFYNQLIQCNLQHSSSNLFK